MNPAFTVFDAAFLIGLVGWGVNYAMMLLGDAGVGQKSRWTIFNIAFYVMIMMISMHFMQ